MLFSDKALDEEARLDANFDDLVRRIKSPSTTNPQQGSQQFYFVYPPRLVLTVRKRIPVWKARLSERENIKVTVISLSDVVWQVIDASGRWNEWLELEEDFDIEDMNRSVTSALEQNDAFINSVVQRIKETAGPHDVVFLTDVELLHPYGRTRPLEHALLRQVQQPVVFLYPGKRIGQYGLQFLEFYPEDSGYRSTIIGGLE